MFIAPSIAVISASHEGKAYRYTYHALVQAMCVSSHLSAEDAQGERNNADSDTDLAMRSSVGRLLRGSCAESGSGGKSTVDSSRQVAGGQAGRELNGDFGDGRGQVVPALAELRGDVDVFAAAGRDGGDRSAWGGNDRADDYNRAGGIGTGGSLADNGDGRGDDSDTRHADSRRGRRRGRIEGGGHSGSRKGKSEDLEGNHVEN
jgi:hypothetical protein